MGKGIVKFLNLGYLAACAVSIWAICTKPIFKASVKLDMTPEKLGEILQPLFASETSSGSESRASAVRGDKQITDYITVERIANSFVNEEEPEKSGLHLSMDVTVAAKYAFDLKNLNVINELVTNNIDNLLDTACDVLSGPLTNFVMSITREFAIDALTTSLDQQVKNALGGDSSITTQEVEDIYNNVYAALSSNEGSIPLSNLTDVIIHGNDETDTSALSILNDHAPYDYQECDPQPSEEVYNANPSEYFVKNAEEKYVNPESYDSEATYYTYIYVVCDPQPSAEAFAKNPAKYFVLDSVTASYKNTESYSATAEYYERKKAREYTQEDLDRVDIEGQMEAALKDVPGLVENTYTLAEGLDAETYNATLRSVKYYLHQDALYTPAAYGENEMELWVKDGDDFTKVLLPNPPDFNETLKSNTYYVLNGENYEEAVNVFNAEATYYTSQAIVKDIDTALAALINQYLLNKGESSGEGEESRAVVRGIREQLTNSKSKEELNAALKEFAYKYIPRDAITAANDSAGKYVPYVLLGIVVLVAFPWALLALVTLIRTFRKYKVWTKPGIVIILAFPQLLFGLVLTYGLKYGLPLAAKAVDIIQKVLDAGATADLRTLCLAPSFVYLAVFAYSIFYVFFAHNAKVEYKLRKRAMMARRYYRDDDNYPRR